jgi:peptidoglycan/LPS O-acetylase OafA/YrhL
MNVRNKSVFLLDINGLRGISVLMVVLYHFNIRIFGSGFIGVDIFFVISGFLMTKIIVSSLLSNNFDYIEFVKRRALRIFPALFILIFILLLVGVLLLPPSDLKSLAEQSLQAVIFNSNNYFASKQGYFSIGADDRWLLHTWSLSVEWQFYMLYPVLLWLFFSVNKLVTTTNSLRLFHILLISALVASLLYCISQDSQSAFFSVLTRAWQMIAGGLVYLAISNNIFKTKYNYLLSYAGIATILASVIIAKQLSLETVWPSYFAIIPILGACLLLLAQYEANPTLNNRFIQNIGKWSYSIYLWHWPLVIALTISGLLNSQPKLFKVLGILVSIFLGYLSYKYVESSKYFKHSQTQSNTVKHSQTQSNTVKHSQTLCLGSFFADCGILDC